MHYTLRKKTVLLVEDTFGRKKESPDTSYLEYLFREHGLVDISSLDSSIRIDLRYSGVNNFLGKDFYFGLRRAYFNCPMSIKVCNAQSYLKHSNPDYSLVIFDATRPHHLQQMMWDSLQMHQEIKKSYLSDPDETSLHNYGCAIDAGIMDLRSGSLLPMGSDFDYFGGVSQPRHETVFKKTGDLTDEMIQNRMLLRRVMKMAGLSPIPSEWWHFSMCKRDEAQRRFELIP